MIIWVVMKKLYRVQNFANFLSSIQKIAKQVSKMILLNHLFNKIWVNAIKKTLTAYVMIFNQFKTKIQIYQVINLLINNKDGMEIDLSQVELIIL